MLLLGVLAAQAEGAVAGAGAYDLLETEILTGTQASVTFSSLNSTYGADYQHLQIRGVVCQTGGLGASNAELKLNSNSLTEGHYLRGFSGSVSSGRNASNAYFYINGTDASNEYSAFIMDFLDPFETTKNTTVRWLAGGAQSTEPSIHLGSGFWNNTAAITTIELVRSWDVGSRFSLYGLRKAA